MGPVDRSRARAGVAGALVVSATLLAVSPLVLTDVYSVLTNTTSEAAAQATNGAWVARGAFFLFGLAVLGLVSLKNNWPPSARWLHRLFGVSMLAVAVFSHRPIASGVPYDVFEDTLHSVAATAMGFAFAAGVLVVGWERIPRWRLLDLIALAASIAIPVAMGLAGDWAGLLQRLLFLIAYVWYVAEAVDRGPALHF